MSSTEPFLEEIRKPLAPWLDERVQAHGFPMVTLLVLLILGLIEYLGQALSLLLGKIVDLPPEQARPVVVLLGAVGFAVGLYSFVKRPVSRCSVDYKPSPDALYGRQQAIDDIEGKLQRGVDLLLLTGTSGSGKSALARLAIRNAQGSIYIDMLTTLSSGDWTTGPFEDLTRKLGLKHDSDYSRVSMEFTALRDKYGTPSLLILDQFEDYQHHYRSHFIDEAGRYISPAALTEKNEFWRLISSLLHARLVKVIIVSRDESWHGLESVRFLKDERFSTYGLLGLDRKKAGDFVHDFESDPEMKSRITFPRTGTWIELKRRIIDDLEKSEVLHPQRVIILMHGLGKLKNLQLKEYLAQNGMIGLETLYVRDAITQAAYSARVTDIRFVFKLLRCMILVKEEKSESRSREEILAAMMDPTRAETWHRGTTAGAVDEVLKQLEHKKIVRPLGEKWQLQHDYYCKSILRAEPVQQQSYASRLQAEDRLARRELARGTSWNTWLWTQLRTLLGPRLQWGLAREMGFRPWRYGKFFWLAASSFFACSLPVAAGSYEVSALARRWLDNQANQHNEMLYDFLITGSVNMARAIARYNDSSPWKKMARDQLAADLFAGFQSQSTPNLAQRVTECPEELAAVIKALGSEGFATFGAKLYARDGDDELAQNLLRGVRLAVTGTLGRSDWKWSVPASRGQFLRYMGDGPSRCKDVSLPPSARRVNFAMATAALSFAADPELYADIALDLMNFVATAAAMKDRSGLVAAEALLETLLEVLATAPATAPGAPPEEPRASSQAPDPQNELFTYLIRDTTFPLWKRETRDRLWVALAHLVGSPSDDVPADTGVSAKLRALATKHLHVPREVLQWKNFERSAAARARKVGGDPERHHYRTLSPTQVSSLSQAPPEQGAQVWRALGYAVETAASSGPVQDFEDAYELSLLLIERLPAGEPQRRAVEIARNVLGASRRPLSVHGAVRLLSHPATDARQDFSNFRYWLLEHRVLALLERTGQRALHPFSKILLIQAGLALSSSLRNDSPAGSALRKRLMIQAMNYFSPRRKGWVSLLREAKVLISALELLARSDDVDRAVVAAWVHTADCEGYKECNKVREALRDAQSLFPQSVAGEGKSQN